MNKNIIQVSLLFTASMMSDFSLTSPTIDLYSDSSTPEVRGTNPKSELTQISQTYLGKHTIDASYLISGFDNVSIRSVLADNFEDIDILESLVKKIQNSKPLSAEFSNVIDEDFWNLI